MRWKPGGKRRERSEWPCSNVYRRDITSGAGEGQTTGIRRRWRLSRFEENARRHRQPERRCNKQPPRHRVAGVYPWGEESPVWISTTYPYIYIHLLLRTPLSHTQTGVKPSRRTGCRLYTRPVFGLSNRSQWTLFSSFCRSQTKHSLGSHRILHVRLSSGGGLCFFFKFKPTIFADSNSTSFFRSVSITVTQQARLPQRQFSLWRNLPEKILSCYRQRHHNRLLHA